MKKKNRKIIIALSLLLCLSLVSNVAAWWSYSFSYNANITEGTFGGGSESNMDYNDGSYYEIDAEQIGSYGHIEVYVYFADVDADKLYLDFYVVGTSADKVDITIYYDNGAGSEDEYLGAYDDDDCVHWINVSIYNDISGFKFEKQILWDYSYTLQLDQVMLGTIN